MPPRISPPDSAFEASPSPSLSYRTELTLAEQVTSSYCPPPTTFRIRGVTFFTFPLLASAQSPPSNDIEIEGDEEDASIIRAPFTFSFPVFGPFDLLRRIQKGAYGSTWAARDQSTSRLICLKVFRPLTDPGIKKSVRTELRMFRRMVKSKGGERGKQFIMELSRSIQQDPVVLFAMELMATDLATYMDNAPQRCKAFAFRWIAQIALGIQSLHDMGIIHRDIKPENILIDSRENVRIIDFGLSYMEPEGRPLREGVGYTDDLMGTRPYMAPEMLRNMDVPTYQRRRYGKAVDWWALGCILFELESKDHQVLFNIDIDTYAYMTWAQGPSQLGKTFPKFKAFDPLVINLLEGLLQVQPSARFSLSDIEDHKYFFYYDGTSEFDYTADRALDRPVCRHLMPRYSAEDEPIAVVEAATSDYMFDWVNLKWACT